MTQPSRIDGLPDLPKLPDHPEPRTMQWSRLELEAIDRYARACYEAGSAAAAQAAKQVPEGFVLVPREATMRVLEAFARTGGHHPARRWPAILDFIAAAPSATSLAEAAVRPPMCRIAGVSEGVLRRAAIANGHGAEAAEAGQVEAEQNGVQK